MKNQLLYFIFILSFVKVTAQFGPQQIISTSTDLPIRTIPYDIDQDGFIDIISASYGDGKICWYKNQNGSGDFSEEIIISEGISALETMELFDLNGDNYLDVVYKTNTNKIAWLENLNGEGDFGTEQIIEDTYYPFFMNAADIDGDGDLDIISIISDGLVWYENSNSLGVFNEAQLIYSNLENSFIISLIDYNNDGLMDLIIPVNNGPGKLMLFKNIGGDFNEPIQIYESDFFISSWTLINSVTVADINGDGKQDIIFDSVYDGDELYFERIFWIENINEEGLFSEQKLVDNEYTLFGSLRNYDIDNDGDMDILAAIHKFNQLENSKIAWYENEDGLGNFSPQQIISTEVFRVRDATASDLNSDGLLDVISASAHDNKIAWYENGVLGINDQNENHFTLYPNPTKGILQFQTNQEISLIEVYNLVGQKVFVTKTELDLTNLGSGVYFVKVKDVDGFSEVHKIIKE